MVELLESFVEVEPRRGGAAGQAREILRESSGSTAGALWKTEGSKRAVCNTQEELRFEELEM